MLARIDEVTQPEQALSEWEYLSSAEPNNADNHAGYAAAALRAGQTDRFLRALVALHNLEPESVRYRSLAAGSALAKGDLAGLREHVERLAKLDPLNPFTQFSLAALRLNSTYPAEAEQGRVSMKEFARGDQFRIRATLALIYDAPRRWPEETSSDQLYNRLADELGLRGPGAAIAPRYVTIRAYTPPSAGLPAMIDHMEVQPSLTANDAVMLVQWLLQTGQGRDALFWLDTLGEPLHSAAAVRQSMASCAVALESWPRLEQLVIGGVWGPVPAEAVKLAFVTRTLQAGRNDSKAGSQWSSAIRLCDQSQPGLRMLQRLAQIWRWPDKQRQVLRVLARQFPADELAWRTLIQLAQAEDKSAELWQIYQAWAQAAPASPAVQAERALVGLLNRPGEAGLGTAADELFHQHPEIPVCRVAQALSLWRGNRAAEALGVLEAAPLNYDRDSRFALVRGLVLAAAGRIPESEKLFASLPSTKILPEERALIAQARKPGN